MTPHKHCRFLLFPEQLKAARQKMSVATGTGRFRHGARGGFVNRIHANCGIAIAAICLITPITGCGESGARQRSGALPALEKRAEKTIADYDSLGKELMALLANPQANIDDRVDAARLLGKMKYLPAIPVLTENIHLMPSTLDEVIPPPPASALNKYGDAAVPSVVLAYLNHKPDMSEKSQWAEIGFLVAIEHGSVKETARTYMKGIAADTTDPQKKERIEQFLNRKSD